MNKCSKSNDSRYQERLNALEELFAVQIDEQLWSLRSQSKRGTQRSDRMNEVLSKFSFSLQWFVVPFCNLDNCFSGESRQEIPAADKVQLQLIHTSLSLFV